MTDDLTPEELEAMKNLPRERMPGAGLEARVVDAMRERGFLARRRRTIVITNSRVAGLLAACVALMVGAYSIGLHRGGGEEVLPPIATLQPDDRGRVEQPALDSREVEQPGADAKKGRTPEAKAKSSVVSDAVSTGRKNEAAAGRDRAVEAGEEGLAKSGSVTRESLPKETPAPPRALEESAARALSPRAYSGPPAPKRSLTFIWNGSPVTVEADSVRVTRDERGRMFIIYTSDGIIRIRLADED